MQTPPVLTHMRVPFLWSLFSLVSFTIYHLLHLPTPSSMGGFAYSDAAGYKSCIESIGFFNTLGSSESFCLRRPLYVLISGFLMIIMQNLFIIQLIFAILFCCSFFYLAKELQFTFNKFTVNVLCAFLSFQWYCFGSVAILTETLALSLGAFSTVFVLRFLRTNNKHDLIYSSILLSVCQLVRPGNLFLLLLPFLLILLSDIPNKIHLFLKTTTCIVLPFTLIKIFGFFLNWKNTNTSSNFWGVLYGLSAGNVTWADAYSIPEVKNVTDESVFWAIVRTKTILNISKNPTEIFENILQNIWFYVEQRFIFLFPDTQFLLRHFSPLFYNLMVLLVIVSFIIYLFKTNKKNRIVFIFVFSTTLLCFGVYKNAEPFRTLSPLHLLFLAPLVESVSYFFSKPSKRKTQKMNLGRRVRLDYNPTPAASFLFYVKKVKLLSIVSCILCLSSFILFTINFHRNTFNFQYDKSCSKPGFVKLFPNSLQVIRIADIPQNNRFYWSQVLHKKSEGFIVYGLFLDVDNKVQVLNAFANKIDNYNGQRSVCFSSLAFEDDFDLELRNIGLQRVEILLQTEK